MWQRVVRNDSLGQLAYYEETCRVEDLRVSLMLYRRLQQLQPNSYRRFSARGWSQTAFGRGRWCSVRGNDSDVCHFVSIRSLGFRWVPQIDLGNLSGAVVSYYPTILPCGRLCSVSTERSLRRSKRNMPTRLNFTVRKALPEFKAGFTTERTVIVVWYRYQPNIVSGVVEAASVVLYWTRLNRFFGIEFRVIGRAGSVAYRLDFPDQCDEVFQTCQTLEGYISRANLTLSEDACTHSIDHICSWQLANLDSTTHSFMKNFQARAPQVVL
jgi:hypothetical protein